MTVLVRRSALSRPTLNAVPAPVWTVCAVLVIIGSAYATPMSLGQLGPLVAAATIFVVALCSPERDVVGHLVASVVAAVSAFPVIGLKGSSLTIPAVIVLSTALVLGTIRTRVELPRSPSAAMLLVLYLVLGLGTFLSGETANVAIYLLLASTGASAFLLVWNATRRDLLCGFVGLATLAVCELALGAREALSGSGPLWGFTPQSVVAATPPGEVPFYLQSQLFDGVNRATGTFGHPLPFAMLFVAFFAIAAAFRRELGMVSVVLAGGAGIAGCLLAGARSALIALVVVAIVTVGRARGFQIALAAILAIVAILFVGTTAIAQRLNLDYYLQTGSFTHRLRVIDALPSLLDQPVAGLFLGTGVNGEGRVIRGIAGGDGFSAVDNQLVSTLIAAGVVGFVLLACVVVRGFRTAQGQVMMAGALVMFFAFDALSWQASIAILAAMFVLAERAPSQPTRLSARVCEADIKPRVTSEAHEEVARERRHRAN